MPGQLHQQRRYLVGIIALFSVVLIWVSSSFVMNNIFTGQDFNKPFLITYINTASFSLYLIPFLLFCNGKPDRRKVSDQEYTRLTTAQKIDDTDGDQRHEPSARPAEVDEDVAFLANKPTEAAEEDQLSTREIAKLSISFCILWFLANWTTNASLGYTTVASSTILASMSGFFTLAIGAMVGIERFNWIKIGAVCVSLLGVILVSTSDSQSSPLSNLTTSALDLASNFFGDFLALAGAFFYGCYTVLLKLRIGNEGRVNMPLFFGFVGAFNICLLWPMFFLLHWTGIEPFEMPSTGIMWAMVLLNAIVGTFLSDYLWLLSMLMTSPLVVTLGLSLTIPFALIGDVLFKHLFLPPQYWCGALLVIAGFVGVNSAALSEAKQEEEENQLEEQHHHVTTTLAIPKQKNQAMDSESTSIASYGSMDDAQRL